MNNIQYTAYPSKFSCNLSLINFDKFLKIKGDYKFLSNTPWNYTLSNNSIITYSNIGIGMGKTSPFYSLDVSDTINCQKLFINNSNLFDIYNSNLNLDIYNIQTNGLLSNNYYFYSNDGFINFPKATTASILLVGAGGRGGSFITSNTNIYYDNTCNLSIAKNSKYQINNESILNIEDGNYNIIFNNGLIILNNTNNNKYKILQNLNPIAWYKFDNPLNIGFDSQETYHLTNNNLISTSINTTFGNYSASFNGTNQYLTITNNLSLNNTDFTISFWVYRFNNNRQESILQFGSVNTLAQRLIILYTSQNNINFGLYGKDNLTIAYPNDANNWIHWVFCYNYINRTIQIYRNGLSVYMDVTINSQINFNNNFYIGTNNQAGISNFNGLLNDLRIYNKELSASQVQELYNIYPNYTQKNKNYLSIKNNNPIAWYKFDNPFNVGFDSQETYNLTNNNFISTSLNSLTGDYSCFLNGTQYLSITNNFGLNNTDFTISFWIYRFNNNRNESILQFGSLNNLGQRLIILYTAQNNINFGLYGKDNLTIAYPNDANKWIHWAFSYNYTYRTIQIYRNGSSVYKDTTINNPINFDNTFYIGTNNQAGISNFIGLIDDLRIYKRQLWDYEIQGLYENVNNNTTIINENTYSTYFITKDNSYPILKDLNDSPINPIAWYKFENNLITIDSSKNNKTLTNVNNVSNNINDIIKGNSSAIFNGTNYFQIDDPTYFSPLIFSISIWVKLTNINNTYKSILTDRSANNGWNIYISGTGTNYPDGSGRVTSYDLEFWTMYSSSYSIFRVIQNYFPQYNNIWKHLCFTIKRTTGTNVFISAYIDGVLIGTNTNIYQNNVVNSLRIGGGATEYTNVSYTLDNGSLINDLRFYNFELSAAQVQELYRGKISIISPIYNNCGGGSAGDIIYYPNYNFNKGNYNIKIGKDSSLPILRDTYIYDSNFNTIIAKGGDDGEPTYNNIDISTNSIYNKTFKFGTYYNINNTGYKYIAAGTYDFIFNQGGLTINNVFNRSYPDITDTNNNIIKPVLWYKFNNSSNFLNEEYYASNNIWNSNCSFDTTNYIKGSGSLAFNAQYSQFVIIPNNINLNTINTTSGISFSIWARFSTRAYSWSRIFDFGVPNPANPSASSNFIFIGIRGGGGELRFEIYNQGSPSTFDTSTANYRDGIWRHYVWTISTTGVWNIYINGDCILSNSSRIVIPVLTTGSECYYLGKSLQQDDYFDGNIDDFRIYSRVLTQADVNKLYKGECKIINFINNTSQITTTLTDTYITNDFVILRDFNNKVINPIRWYKFNINGILDDSSGNNISGTLQGTNASTIVTLDTTNFIKGNASLNNTSVNFCYFKFALTKQPPISFCYWIRFNSFSSWCVFSYNNDANSSSLQMDITAPTSTTGYFLIYTALPSRWNIILSGASYQLFTNKWYFVSITYGIKSTGTVVKLYINGILIASSTGSVDAEFPTIGTVYVGKSGDGNRGFDGKFNDVRVYDFELSEKQINYLYNGNNYKIDSNTLIKFNNENENYILKDNYNIYSSNGNFAIGSYISTIDKSYPILNITPILWYKFENSTDFENDHLNNSFNKLYNSSCSFHTSDFIKGNGSLYFNSTINAHIRIPNVIDFNAINKNKGITFSFWAKLNSSTPNWGRILFFGQSYIANPFVSSNHIQIAREGTSGNLYFKIGRAPLNTDNGTFGSSYSFNEIYLRNFNYFDGVWRHFIWSISPTGEWSIYINGILVYYINNYIIIPYFNPLYQYNFIGKSIEGYNHPFNGYLDDFRIYDEVLSLNQIIELYNGNIKILNTDSRNNAGKFIDDFNYNYIFTSNISNFNIPFQSYIAINNDDIIPITSNNYTINFNKGVTTVNNINLSSTYHILKNDNSISLNPIIWYKFENSNNMLIDSSGNNYNLINNGATFDSNNYIKRNGSVNLGLNKYVITENNINFYGIQKNKGITFSFWGKFSSSTPNSASILSIPNQWSSTAYVYIARNALTQNLEFNINNENINGNILILNVPSISFFNDIWFHLVWSISPNGEWSIFINGIKQLVSKTISFNSTGAHNTKMTLGWAHTATVYYVIGNIDDFRIYDFVLNANQVQELYNNGINIYTNSKYPVLKNDDLISLNPLVWYKFDTSNNLGFDSSSNKIHLSNIGSVLTSNDIIKGESSILFNSTNYLNYNSNFTYNNGIVSYNSNYTYLIYTNDGSITFNQDSVCDLIVVGAGGRGGGNPNINMTITTNTSNITINKQAIYNINDGEYSNLPMGTYNYSFNNGIINIEKQIDNNYPILRYSSNNSEIIPTAWYKFDDPINLGYCSTNSNYNLINNNATYNTNIYLKGTGSCSILRANTQYLTLNNLNFTNLSFTISLWSYLLSYESSGETPLFAKGDNISTTSQALFCEYQGTNIQFGFYGDDTTGGNFPNDINKWINWVFTYNKDTKKRKIYRNGNFIAEGNALSAGYIPSTHNYRIGGFYLNNSQKYFNGYIDDFRIYNTELSAIQIQKLYNDTETFYNITDKSYPIIRDLNNFEILPLVWYKFDNSTNIGLDSMNKHNLTNNGSTTYSTADFIKGIGCASFNGTTQYLNKTSAFNLNNKDFTISAWIKRDRNNTSERFLRVGENSIATNQQIGIGITSTNFPIMDFNGTGNNLIGTEILATNIWYHIVFTFNNTSKTRSLYLNGIFNATNTSAGQVISTNNTFEIGRTPFYQGLMDDVRIYEIELTPTQVQELYNGRVNIYYPKLNEIDSDIGGGGQVINYPNYKFNTGTYNFNIGIDSDNSNNRITKIKNNNYNDLITSVGGSDGGVFAIERRYPPNTFDAISSNIPIQTTYNNCNCYKTDLYISPENSTYGSGTYEIYFSSINSTIISERNPALLFDNIYSPSIMDAPQFGNNYSTLTTGNFLYTSNLVEPTYYGDWILIKLPIPIILKSYTFYGREGYLTRVPKTYKIYASTNGINWVILDNTSNLDLNYYQNNYLNYTKYLHTNITKYQYYCLTVNQLMSNGESLNFLEWELKGIEELSSIKTLNSAIGNYNLTSNQRRYPPKPFTNTTLTTNEVIRTLNNLSIYGANINLDTTNITYGSGIYEINYNGVSYITTASNQSPLNLFNNSNNSIGTFSLNTYDITNGKFIGNTNNLNEYLFDNNFKGSWISIKLPKPIILTSYDIYPVNNIITPGIYNVNFNNGGITIGNNSITDKSYPILIDNLGNIINPIVWYKFDDSTNLGLDTIGNHNLTNNGTTFNTSNFIKGSGSISFSTGNYLDIPKNFNLKTLITTNGLSFGGWVFINSSTNIYSGIFCFGDVSNFCLVMANPYLTGIRFQIQTTTININIPSFNTWVHWFWTMNTTGLWNIYINGVNVSSSITLLVGNFVLANSQYRLGYFTATTGISSFIGLMDDFRIYDRELTASQVSELYTGRLELFNISSSIYSLNGYLQTIKSNTSLNITSNLFASYNYNPTISLNNCAKKFKIYGSNSGINEFKTIDSVNLTSANSYNPYYNNVILNNTSYFDNYCFTFNQIFQGQTSLSLNEIILYGIEDTDILFTNNLNSTNYIETITGNNLILSSNNSIIKSNIKGNYITSNINSSNFYALFNSGSNNSIYIPNNCFADIMVIGAGGRGGIGPYSGGGGAGEVIYYSNLKLLKGDYLIDVGFDSSNPLNRISRIKLGSNELIKANGGGDGGSNFIINKNTENIIISQNTIYSINYGNVSNISKGVYNAFFQDGIISFNSIQDKSYPILKDINGNDINPTCWYKFDDSANIGLDTMNYANLTKVNDVTLISGIKGEYSVDFNLDGEYLHTNSFPNLSDKSFSISFWCILKDTSCHILAPNAGFANASTRNILVLYYANVNSIAIRFGGDDDLSYTSSTSFLNKLVFVCITFNKNNNFEQKIYINGVNVASRNAGGVLNLISPTDYALGRRNFVGVIDYGKFSLDDFRVYVDIVLTPAQIQELYYGRIEINYSPTSGGSGGGGYSNLTPAQSGIPFDNNNSKLASGNIGISLINSFYWDGVAIDTINRRFPPKLFNSYTTKVSSIFNGKTCHYSSMTLDTTNITYGSGIYETWWSTAYGNTGYDTQKLFDWITNDSGLATLTDNYQATTGNFLGTIYFQDSDYLGDWICIKLPIAIALTSYQLIQRINFSFRAPKNFRIYASNDGITWVILQTITNATYNGVTYTSTGLTTNTNVYLYYCLAINALIGGNVNSIILNFAEWVINGKQIIYSSIIGGYGGSALIASNYSTDIIDSFSRIFPSKLYDSFSTKIITTLNGQECYLSTLTLNNTDITYGAGKL